jgi:hypothetical protein
MNISTGSPYGLPLLSNGVYAKVPLSNLSESLFAGFNDPAPVVIGEMHRLYHDSLKFSQQEAVPSPRPFYQITAHVSSVVSGLFYNNFNWMLLLVVIFL